MYDYLSAVSADVDITLSVNPDRVIIEEFGWNQTVLEADDESDVVISHSSNPIIYVTMEWEKRRPTDIGTILDIYADSTKAKGRANSFKLDLTDGHIYVVKFRDRLTRTLDPNPHHSISKIRLKVIGRINDA